MPAQIDSDKTDGGGNWQVDMMNALKNADGIIPIFTENTFPSQFVPSEIGMARAFRDAIHKDMFIIPLVVSMEIPYFVSDLQSIRINSSYQEDLNDAAKNDQAIKNIVAKRKKYPKIFISHRHKDTTIVKALLLF